jgi:hypothetical protein
MVFTRSYSFTLLNGIENWITDKTSSFTRSLLPHDSSFKSLLFPPCSQDMSKNTTNVEGVTEGLWISNSGRRLRIQDCKSVLSYSFCFCNKAFLFDTVSLPNAYKLLLTFNNEAS